MRRYTRLLPLIVAIIVFGRLLAGCSGDTPVNPGDNTPAGPIPSGDYINGIAAVLTDSAANGAIIVQEDGETLVAMTDRDAQNTIVGVTGSVYSVPGGTPFILRFDIFGWPKHATYGDYVIFFRDWTNDMVDIAVVGPNENELHFYSVKWNTDNRFSQSEAMRRPYNPYAIFTNHDISSLEPLAAESSSTSSLSTYGRSMQSYGYSVLPRSYQKGNQWRYTLRWTLTGANIGLNAFRMTGMFGPETAVFNGELAKANSDIMDSQYLTPLYLTNAGHMRAGKSVRERADNAVYMGNALTVTARERWQLVKNEYADFINHFYYNDIYDSNTW
jgi:hypothetical protein